MKHFTQISIKPSLELRKYDRTDRKQDTLSFKHLIVITITWLIWDLSILDTHIGCRHNIEFWSWTMFDYKFIKNCFGMILCIFIGKVSVPLVLRDFTLGVIQSSLRRRRSVLYTVSVVGSSNLCHYLGRALSFAISEPISLFQTI